MCESDMCFSSLFCWNCSEGSEFFCCCFLCFSCCWPTKDENDGWFLLIGKEPNLMKMSPRQPSAYYFSILDVLYGCPGKRNEIKCVILTFHFYILNFPNCFEFKWVLGILQCHFSPVDGNICLIRRDYACTFYEEKQAMGLINKYSSCHRLS